MKDKALGYGFWLMIGMLVVGIAGSFFVNFIRQTINDVGNQRPRITPPPVVSEAELPEHVVRTVL